MQLIILLTTCLSILCYKTYGQDHLSDPLTVIDPDAQCEQGWSFESCDENKVWLVKPSHKIPIEKEIAHIESHDIDQCIKECLKQKTCTGVTIDRLSAHGIGSYCYLLKDVNHNQVEGNHTRWSAIIPICCKIIQKNHLSTNPNHNLPIIVNLRTDCEPQSIKTRHCSEEERVWHVQEEKVHEESNKISFYQRNECLNQCIDKGDCVSVDDAPLKESCYLDPASDSLNILGQFNSFSLKCCNLKEKELWQNRIRNLPILYDTKKMCVSHELFNGQQQCDVKVWIAIEGAVMVESSYNNISVANFRMINCLNECLKEDCFGVSIKKDTCYFYNKDNVNLKYGYRLFTSYRLACCNIKINNNINSL